MLDKLRDRATRILAETGRCTLSTTGPAGLQASMVLCTGQGTTLYVLIPDTSDHLFNLENEPNVAVTAETWRLHGTAAIVHDSPELFAADQRQWHTIVRVTPVRLHILPAQCGSAHQAETIDFDG
ncbi:MAG: pyridoxamine 5'-phosphate oxidase family protein [Anaerolineaceae bacterium]|nr:pyridoxamine 5'-phosphate oxidase family protein [Anaerolineaceae bacterium]MCB9099369.1 pyridoxamine 5'-phosphate oxidase family protein [Anaerolineales bacterium]